MSGQLSKILFSHRSHIETSREKLAATSTDGSLKSLREGRLFRYLRDDPYARTYGIDWIDAIRGHAQLEERVEALELRYGINFREG